VEYFPAVFCFALAFAFISGYEVKGAFNSAIQFAAASFFVAILIGIAIFGLFQAVFMANAGGAWDNAKKVVEVDLKMKGTPLHDATIVGDTVGDLSKILIGCHEPIIKFTIYLFISHGNCHYSCLQTGCSIRCVIFFVIALYFVWRHFIK